MKKQDSVERDPDVTVDRNAEEAGAALVLADRDHGAPERRAQNETHDADRDGEAEQDEVIEGVGVRQDVDREQTRDASGWREKPRKPSSPPVTELHWKAM